MSKKRLIRNKPRQNELGVYTYKDDNLNTDYLDSDSLPIRYDKFEGKDLSSVSIGDTLNEYILDSYIQELNGVTDGVDNNNNPKPVTRLRYEGQNFVEINSVTIKNRGVNTRINDVYFRFYIFSSLYYDPFTANGTARSAADFLNSTTGVHQGDIPAGFYYQGGPNYGENGEPGDGLFQDIRILEDFSSINKLSESEYDANTGTGKFVDIETDYDGQEIVTDTEIVVNGTNRSRDGFDPRQTMLIRTLAPEGGITLDGVTYDEGEDISTRGAPYIPPGNLTTIFQEDGTPNNVYIALFMDGDMNPKRGPDRSRDETLNIWTINPEELFDSAGGGKVTVLEWDDADIEKFNHSAEKTAAFSATKLKVTINTIGGIREDDITYNPPAEYKTMDELTVIPPISRYNSEMIDELILDMNPSREILKQELDVRPYGDERVTYGRYLDGMFADYIPIPRVELLSDTFDTRDFQIYYEDMDDRLLMSAPTTVNLTFDVGLNPEPNITIDPYYFRTVQEKWNDIELVDRYSVTGQDIRVYGEEGDELTNNPLEIISNNDYMFFVIDWNDVDNIYQTMDDVMAEWPESLAELVERRKNNLYYPKVINRNVYGGFRNYLKHNYSTPGMKRIKSIMFSHTTDTNITDGIFKGTEGYENPIEPLRWKLVTTTIFVDIPSNEFPDFGQLGGDDYNTIPWPYTTPIIGGISGDSKYSKSISNILGGGKIGDLDIIDETFLIQAKENDELGKNIEKLDLEQCRYFNTGDYDINRLLNIPTAYYEIVDESPENLINLDFPIFYEEFDSWYMENPQGDDPVLPEQNPFSEYGLDMDDVTYWLGKGRPDIAEWIRINYECYSDPQNCRFLSDKYDEYQDPNGNTIVATTPGGFVVGNQSENFALPYDLFYSQYFPIYQANKEKLFQTSNYNNGGYACYIDASNFHWIDTERVEGPSYNKAVHCKPLWMPSSGLPTPLEGLFSNNPSDYNIAVNGDPPSDWNQVNEVFDGDGPGSGGFGEPTQTGINPFDFYEPDGSGPGTGLTCVNPSANVFYAGRSYDWSNYWWWDPANPTNNLDFYNPIWDGPSGINGGDYFCYKAFQIIAGNNFAEHMECGTGDVCEYSDGYTYYEEYVDSVDYKLQSWEAFFLSNVEFNYDENIHKGNPQDGFNIYYSQYEDGDSKFNYTSPNGNLFYVGDSLSLLASHLMAYESEFPSTDPPSFNSLYGWVELLHIVNAYLYNGEVPLGFTSTTLSALGGYEGITTRIGQEMIQWAQNTFPAQYQDAPLPSGEITDGCDERIPPGTLWLNSDGDVLYKFDSFIDNEFGGMTGIQFTPYHPSHPMDVIDIIPNYGAVYDTNWSVNYSGNQILAFRLPSEDSTPIYDTCGTLMKINVASDTGGWIETEHSLRGIVVGWSNEAYNEEYGYTTLDSGWTPTVGCNDPNALHINESLEPNPNPDNYYEEGRVTFGYEFNNLCVYPDLRFSESFNNTVLTEKLNYVHRYNDYNYWDGGLPEKTFPEESSVGQIFIDDNIDRELTNNCKLEFNAGNITDKSIIDSSGNTNKGLLIGDYKIKKSEKNQPMRRDSFIKIPKKTGNKDGAL